MGASGSLDKWREYFGRGESDIFGIIENAIMVAAADCPDEFKARRDKIAEVLFSCKVSRCIGCDHHEVKVAGEEGEAAKPVVEETGGVKDDGSAVVDEIMRIKEVLLNKDDEPNSVVFEALRKLESMSMTLHLLMDTAIGKTVTGLRKHPSEKISKLAKALLVEWKGVVDEWMNPSKENAVNEDDNKWTPDSALDEELDVFPSPPYDFDFFAHEPFPHEPAGYELSQFFDGLDCDGNLSISEEPKEERKLQSARRPNGTNEGNVVERYNNTQLMKREEADVRTIKHSATDLVERRRQPKQSREQMVPATQRKPLVVAEQKRKLAAPRVDNLKGLDADAKFEFAKRKLQESYQQHERAKKQRTIQVLDMIPNQSKAKKPLFKKPMRR